jgi:hypothetical protein
MDEDLLVALELGADDVTGLTELQLQYKDKIKERLMKVCVSVSLALQDQGMGMRCAQ